MNATRALIMFSDLTEPLRGFNWTAERELSLSPTPIKVLFKFKSAFGVAAVF
jgi:hypothetical protein